MKVDDKEFIQRYAELSDAGLLSIDADELVDGARQCYERELAGRGLRCGDETHEELERDWLDSAATACYFQVGTGRRYAEDAKRAYTILRDAGIPSRVVVEHEEGGPDLLVVMVPGQLSLKATSVLDRDIFNQELEETWRTHFDELSEEELHALQPNDICAGLLDRAARLKRVYEEALARRTPQHDLE